MSSSVLERMRGLLESSEHIERQIGEQLDAHPTGQKRRLEQQHMVARLVRRQSELNEELLSLYADEDGVKLELLMKMSGPQTFRNYYDMLARGREYAMQQQTVYIDTDQQGDGVEEPVKLDFSGDEIFGKYLDLHALFLQYCNLPALPSRDLDYTQYLAKFNSFFYLPEPCRRSKPYARYVKDLWEYLSTFFCKVQPLIDVAPLVSEWERAFGESWADGKVSGWKSADPKSTATPQPLRLGMFSSVEELEALGAARLKEGLDALGLKAGGTLSERAERLFSVRGKKPEEIPIKLRVKGGSGVDRSEHDHRETASIEWCVERVCELLMDVVVATRRHAEKQHLRTVEEKEAEIAEEELGQMPELGTREEEEADDEGPLYNPLNLPLGWDGKPIPFWLYKLHGLGVEFKCEICGNQSYWGRRAFDKHFQEWRHAQGMRCLGIPNTKHFHDITLIADAVALHSTVRHSLQSEAFQGDVDEEFEDSDGNVLNRRTYEDLARQGLL